MRLLLVGAGHAHLEILRRLILEPLPEVELTVVSLGPLHHYSGMVPGYLQGTYREEEIAVRVPDLVARAGGRFVAGRAVGVDPGAAVRVETGGGEREIPYDLVSFAVGSNTAGHRRSRGGGRGAADQAAGAGRRSPAGRLLALAGGRGRDVPLAVVGGGAAGVEVALRRGARCWKERDARAGSRSSTPATRSWPATASVSAGGRARILAAARDRRPDRPAGRRGPPRRRSRPRTAAGCRPASPSG